MMCTVTTIANPVVNFCLIPETDFTAEGLLKALERRFASGKAHTVIVVAEGAGQRLIEGESAGVDATGQEFYMKDDFTSAADATMAT